MELYDGEKTYQADPTRFTGLVDQATIGLDGLRISAWLEGNPDHTQDVTIGICHEGQLLAKSLARPRKVVRGDQTHTEKLGATILLPTSSIPAPIRCDLAVVAFHSNSEIFTELPRAPAGTPALEINILNDHDFVRLVQNPSTRLKDEASLLYTSILSLNRFATNEYVTAGALCVIGYRLIHTNKYEPEVASNFLEHVDLWLSKPSKLPLGHAMRWTISIRLIAAYFDLYRGQTDNAIVHLKAITTWRDKLSAWPSSLTNILLAQYGLGYVAYARKDSKTASSIWLDAVNFFKIGAAGAEFKNVYSFGELGNALIVSRECFIGSVLATTGLPTIQDPNKAQPGTRLDPKVLPAPLGWLLPKAD